MKNESLIHTSTVMIVAQYWLRRVTQLVNSFMETPDEVKSVCWEENTISVGDHFKIQSFIPVCFTVLFFSQRKAKLRLFRGCHREFEIYI